MWNREGTVLWGHPQGVASSKAMPTPTGGPFQKLLSTRGTTHFQQNHPPETTFWPERNEGKPGW